MSAEGNRKKWWGGEKVDDYVYNNHTGFDCNLVLILNQTNLQNPSIPSSVPLFSYQINQSVSPHPSSELPGSVPL